jgi:flagellar biosynthesis protein FlhB
MSDDNDDSDKTEDPSAKKLEEARQKGQIPQSKEIVHWFMILAAGIIVYLLSPAVSHQLYTDLISFWAKPHDFSMESTQLGDVLLHTMMQALLAMLLPFLLLMAAGILAHVLQFGLLFAPDSLQPKLERISLIKGFERMFSMRSVVELIKGIIKIAVVGTVIYVVIKPVFDESPNYVNYDSPGLLHLIYALTGKILMVVVVVLSVIAIIDWLYQRYTFMQQMRMSKQELKDEYRQSEGDPIIKQRLRQMRADKARKRMMAAVPKATAIVTNPTHYAIALLYEDGKMEAPKLVAKGVDTVALKIREIAKEHNVPIMENPPLARALFANVEIDEEIPADYYKAVAEIISFVFRLRKNKR